MITNASADYISINGHLFSKGPLAVYGGILLFWMVAGACWVTLRIRRARRVERFARDPDARWPK